jgi:hypothetical protein
LALLLETTVPIDAAAVAVDAHLITGNPKHFPMPELEVVHWPVGV